MRHTRVSVRAISAPDPDDDGPFPLRLGVLGGFSLTRNGGTLDVPESVWRLIVFLALHPGRHPRGFVAGSLWPDRTDDRASANLRTALWRLTASEGSEVIGSDPRSVWLADEVDVDLARVRDAMQRQLADPDGDPLTLDRDAIERTLLPGWYDDWVLFERERLEQLRSHCLELIVAALSRVGRHAEAVDVALHLVAADLYRERSHLALIAAYAAEGSHHLALRQYERLRRVCLDTFGAEPAAGFASACQGGPSRELGRRPATRR